MTHPFVDTDVIVRLITGDDPKKQAAAKALFEQVEQGHMTLTAPDTVIADAVFVLSSPRLYHLPRPQVSAMLIALVRLPHFRVRNRPAVLRALELYATVNRDFGDLLIVASMEQANADTRTPTTGASIASAPPLALRGANRKRRSIFRRWHGRRSHLSGLDKVQTAPGYSRGRWRVMIDW